MTDLHDQIAAMRGRHEIDEQLGRNSYQEAKLLDAVEAVVALTDVACLDCMHPDCILANDILRALTDAIGGE